MGQKDKLIQRLKSKPKDFTFDDAETLLKYLDYIRSSKGKTRAIKTFGTGGAYMNNTIEYKGYIGSVEFSQEDGLFFGKVMGIRSLISYEGENATDLISDFHGAVDDYLSACEAAGKEPEKAYKGSFNIRISPELHKQLVVCATSKQMSLNSFVENALQRSVQTQAGSRG